MPPSPLARSLRWLALALFGLAAYNALGALSAAGRYAFLQLLPLAVPAAYLLASRAVWALVWLGLAAGVWRRRGWARWGALAGAALYLGQDWLNRLAWGNTDYALQTWPWSVIIQAVLLALLAGVVIRSEPWR